MSKVARVDAFYEISKAIRINDFDKANKMLKIVVNSIANDKKNNTIGMRLREPFLNANLHNNNKFTKGIKINHQGR